MYLNVKLRDGTRTLKCWKQTHFKNNNDVYVVYRVAVRATSSEGLMELAVACPGDLDTESEPWTVRPDGGRCRTAS